MRHFRSPSSLYPLLFCLIPQSAATAALRALPHPLSRRAPSAGPRCCACRVVRWPLNRLACLLLFAAHAAGRPILYKGPWHCLATVIKEEGFLSTTKGVYAGLPANLLKLAPTGALTFMAVEVVKDTMGWR